MRPQSCNRLYYSHTGCHQDSPAEVTKGPCSCHGINLMLLGLVQGREQIGGALYSLDIGTGKAELLLDNWNGLRFNSPNDLVVCMAQAKTL